MKDELVTLEKLENDIKSLKLLADIFNPEIMEQLKDKESQLDSIRNQISAFSATFSDHGWCAYDSMSLELMERANNTFRDKGIEAAEDVLVNYYQTDVRKITHWIKKSSKAFAIRQDLIQRFFDDHFDERYHASVPLGLIIVDGAVNDFTKSKGFFAEGTSVSAWDCLVGCSESLTKIKNIFNQKRAKTNSDPILLPYRNGILHGRDLNYANQYVSCKCVSLIFAIADWMKMKSSEEKRKAEYIESMNPPSIIDTLTQIKENEQIRSEIDSWKSRSVVIGKDIPKTGEPKEYKEYPYVVEIVEMMSAWRTKNYGKLSCHLREMFPSGLSEGKLAGECRKMFEDKTLVEFEIVEIKEHACAVSKIVVKTVWSDHDSTKEAILTFGSVYKGDTKAVALPWRNNGKWVLMPWNVRGLYQ